MPTRLNQILAQENNIKNRTKSTVEKLYQALDKTALFDGFVKTYAPNREDGDRFPNEVKRIEANAQESLKEAAQAWRELLDVTAKKDLTNCVAKADLVVDGETLATGLPVPFLLFLEKRLSDMRAFVTKLPTLSPDEEWKKDETRGIHVSGQSQTTKTKKEQRPIVLYDATDKHPAQTQLITEDISIGTWTTVKQSGAIPVPHKKALVERVDKLLRAVVTAREEANQAEVRDMDVGDAIMGFLTREG